MFFLLIQKKQKGNLKEEIIFQMDIFMKLNCLSIPPRLRCIVLMRRSSNSAVLNSFTGHETLGKYSEEFKQIIVPFLKEKFKNYISEYNSIIQNKIIDKIDESLKFVKSQTDINNYDFKRFETDIKRELSEI